MEENKIQELEEKLAHLYDIFYNKEKRPQCRKGIRKHILNLEEQIDRLKSCGRK